MRKLVAGFAVSLDGYLEGPNGEYDWMYAHPAPEFDFAESARRFDTFLIGRKTYEKLAAFNEPAFKQYHNYVFSHQLTAVADGYQLVSGDAGAFVQELKSRSGKDIAVYGGAELLASLLDLNLVNEISMTVVPILLGQGKPMVSVLRDRVWLTLVDTKTYSNGNVQLTYSVAA